MKPNLAQRLAAALALVITFAAIAAAPASAQETRIVAVVNDDVITGADLNARLNMVLRTSQIPDTPETRQRIASQVLRGLIDEKLQMQEAKRFSIKVPEKDVNDALGRIEEQNHMPKGGLETFLKQAGIDRQTLVDQITAALAWNKLIQNRLVQNVTVSDEEINETLGHIKENAGKPQSRVSEIFLAVDNPSQDEDVRKLAERLIEQIRTGANFAGVAQQFSQSPTAAVGGDIGWVTPGQISGPIGDAIERLRPGELSPPVRAVGGYYLIFLVDRKTPGEAGANNGVVTMAQVVFPVPPTSTPEERQRAAAMAQQVSDTAKSCGEMAKIGREKSPQLSGTSGALKIADFPPEIRQLVTTLKVAEASKPMPLRGGIGVLMVCERREAPSPIPTRDVVADALSRQRLDALARRYLRDLRRTAFVDMRG